MATTYKEKAKKIKLADILTGVKDDIYDVRVETKADSTDSEVEALREAYLAQVDIPAITVTPHPSQKGKYLIVDGRRRLMAQRALSREVCIADVVEGKPSDLILLSGRKNATHGTSMTIPEKKAWLARFILENQTEKGKLPSQQQLAQEFTVSQATVSNVLNACKEGISLSALREGKIVVQKVKPIAENGVDGKKPTPTQLKQQERLIKDTVKVDPSFRTTPKREGGRPQEKLEIKEAKRVVGYVKHMADSIDVKTTPKYIASYLDKLREDEREEDIDAIEKAFTTVQGFFEKTETVFSD